MTTVADVFINAAQSALGFLEQKHGFSVCETIAPPVFDSTTSFWEITYRRSALNGKCLFVSLATGPARLELDLTIGRGWPPQYHDSVRISELIDVESPLSTLHLTYPIYDSFGDLGKMIVQYSALGNALNQHGARFFAEDDSLWIDVQKLREDQSRKFKNNELSKDAEIAFKNGDWNRTIDLMEAISDTLTKLQSARLSYARKQLKA
jgi:hypothetical protein